jgi:hypothetical protein
MGPFGFDAEDLYVYVNPAANHESGFERWQLQ